MTLAAAERPLPSTSIFRADRPTVGELHERAQAVAAVHADWRYLVQDSKNADGELCYRAVIAGPDWTVSLSHESSGGEDRLIARAYAPYSLPTGGRYHEPYGFTPARATFAWRRTATAIAAEIARRVVPSARQLAAHYTEASREFVSLQKRQEAAVEALRAGGLTVHDARDATDLDQNFYGRGGDDSTYVHGHVRSGSCTIERLSVSAEQVVCIAAMLGAAQ